MPRKPISVFAKNSCSGVPSKRAQLRNVTKEKGGKMGYLNKVLLIGRLGQDPEKRITPSGHTVVNISLATTEYFKDQGGNKQERTEWHRVVFWDRQAELIEQYCRKGSQLFVEGSLQTREWQDKEGNRRFTTDIIARNMQFLDSKGSGESSGFQKPETANVTNYPQTAAPDLGAPPEKPPASAAADDFIEDDIPF